MYVWQHFFPCSLVTELKRFPGITSVPVTKIIMMKIIGTRAHGYLDYIVAILLIAAPWIFGFYEGGAASWVPIGLGLMTIIYSLFTKYELGVLRRLNMSTHLTLDVISGFLLALSPWLLSFAHIVWLPHVIVGVFEIATASMTKIVPDGKVKSFASM